MWKYLNSQYQWIKKKFFQLLSHTLNLSPHCNPKVQAGRISLCKFIPKLFSRSHPTLLAGHFSCYTMTSWLLMIGANLLWPAQFLLLLFCPLPPNASPFRPWHPTPLMSSRPIQVEQQFPPAATRSIFDVVTLPPALAYTPPSPSVRECVCVCMYVRKSVKTDQGECMWVCVFLLYMYNSLFVWPHNNMYLT